MDIHIILETGDAVELAQAERLINHLKLDLANVLPAPPFVPVPLTDGNSTGGINEITSGAVRTKTSTKKKTTPTPDPRQIEINTESVAVVTTPAVSPGDYSTPVLAAQSLARSRKDGVASVVALVKEFGVARVSDLPKEKHVEFMSRAQALAAEPVSS